ncbi:dna polymerase delta subunit [Cystoisospora suis]|uniref:Dna polymerase delta subunit n=1 Tax=Cystoisospora suis TaxID=483139 RepID=A0A2C6LAR0_9APIC|nr:dna polymerase delta subunit [Cystoisospora suis]
MVESMDIDDQSQTPKRGELHARKATKDGRQSSSANERKHVFAPTEKRGLFAKNVVSPLCTPPVPRHRLPKAQFGGTSTGGSAAGGGGSRSDSSRYHMLPGEGYRPSVLTPGDVRELPLSRPTQGDLTPHRATRQTQHRRVEPSIASGFNRLQVDCSSAAKLEEMLCRFDVAVQYGPCCGLTRLERWNRAAELGLNPPEDLRLAVERTGNNISIFDQRLTKFGVTNPEHWR